MSHPGSGEMRYRMWNFYNNHDQRRICITKDGPAKNRLAALFLSVWPGIPLFYFGDEQGLCSFGTALEGHSRESFMRSIAWKNHPSPFDENPASKDNFDMTHPDYLFVQRLMEVRSLYPALRHTNSIDEHYSPKAGARGLYAFSRTIESDGSSVLVLVNTSDRAISAKDVGKIETPWKRALNISNALFPSEKIKLDKDGSLTDFSIEPLWRQDSGSVY